MRVLHIVASLSHKWGGPIPVIKGLSEALVRKDVEVSVFAPVKYGEREIVRPEGVEVHTFRQDLLSKIWTAHSCSLSKVLRKEAKNFDLIHIHEIWHHPHFAAYLAAQKASKPYIVAIHGALEPRALNYKGLKKKIYAALIQKRILNKAAAIHAITQEEVEHIRAFGVKTPVIIIPNGVDPKEFKDLPPREEIERFYPELIGKRVLLFLGRIHPIKGLDILIKAFGQIAKIEKNLHLLIVGPDEEGYRSQIERFLETEGIIDRVTFTGMLIRRKKLAVLSRADIFILSSYSEGFSMAILEAMVCKLPVVITRQCHFSEVAEVGAGIVIEPDAKQLADALTTLIDNPMLCKKMGENGHKFITEKFTWDKIANQMIELYHSVLQ